ncbi:hypothetical protein KIN20_029265 [Parelaphostrongylus tenuis]|uniref:Uncharacterized protein n=1 Tax=Parelaphostrongylus tenuis TaxID=148309 RepID=A0AAD5R2E8_PARTN|nr:hypothetical protein KIN20_029265 [Parelaphostrongylus tenuis]
MHISCAYTVKLWFYTEAFAKNCIDLIANVLDVRCVDVYPYKNVHILPYLHYRLPHLAALNMRPHSNEFHSCGLQLPSFPDFSKLTTLILDNYSIDGDFQLPKTIRSLDYSKREQSHYQALLPKLAHLTNLEYFTLSHADMSNPVDFIAFVRVTLRMCKICPLNLQDGEIEMNLKLLKFDLCYGNILSSIRDFLGFNKVLNVLSLNVLSNRSSLDSVCNICSELERRRIALYLSILQNYPKSLAEQSPFENLAPPTSWFNVVTKFEASFINDVVLFETLILSGQLHVLRECKFVECDAVTSDLLTHLSMFAPMLRRLDALSCSMPEDMDVLLFVPSISTRIASQLQITWRQNDRHAKSLAECYLALKHERQDILKGKKARFTAKTFSSVKRERK